MSRTERRTHAYRGIARPSKRDMQMSANLTSANVLTPKESAYRLNEPSLRPVDYTQEIGSAICDHLFNGETLSEICRDAAMPDKPTVMRWLAQYPKFLDEYLFTCQLLAEDLAAEAVSIADKDNHASLRLALRDRPIRKIVHTI
jgi:hypothetical protein